MRDLRVKCFSGDNDSLLFGLDMFDRGIPADASPHILIRDSNGACLLWLSRDQTKRLSEWLAETLSQTTEQEPEEI